MLRSTDPTSSTVIASTIIDGRRLSSVITFIGSELTTCTLSGFTIMNGRSENGGGIVGNGTRATIIHNIVKKNAATASHPDDALGGGILNCHGLIQNNTITENEAHHGAGLYNCHGQILNNIISNNSAGYTGGGLDNCGGTIENNTISGNSGGYGFGGGLYDCDGTIQNNTISNNSADIGGGVGGCDGIIQYNIISHNIGSGGGGGLSICNGIIQDNIISGNRAVETSGGGLSVCHGTIQNNIICGNSAWEKGGGLSWCNGTIQNNTIFGNSVINTRGSGGGLYSCEGIIRNCIIWQNTAFFDPQLYKCSTPSYSCIQGWIGGGTGNISAYPLLSDPKNGNFHLDYYSPCIDAGCYIDDLAEDFEGDTRGYDASSEARGDGSDYDIGVDEFIAIPSNHRPDKPANLSPVNGETGVSLPATLESSAFSDPDSGDIHTASQWQIDNNSDFSTPEFDSGVDYFNKISIVASSEILVNSTEYYYWRVRHRDNHGYWSEWSDPTYFLTLPPGMIAVPGDFPTIQAAIDAASQGDIITVSPGTYYENIHFKGENIILCSTDPTSPPIIASTIIHGNNEGSVVSFSGNELPNCVLSGFTITKGSAERGGGINGNYTLATIQNNTINGNLAKYSGGGLHMCDGIIQNNIIRGNSANNGGGLYRCHGTIQNNTISGNLASFSKGGGLYVCEGTIQNNTISGNWAKEGGGLFYCNGKIQNNLISDNSAGYGGGLSMCDGTIQCNIITGNLAWKYSGGGLYDCDGVIQNNTIWGNYADDKGGGLCGSSATIRNCIIWQNTAASGSQLYGCPTPSYSYIQGWTGGGTANTSANPQLVDPDNGDFHLIHTSPCIDAGCYIPGMNRDFEGDPRPWNGTSEPRGDGSDFDIGADEFIFPIHCDFMEKDGWTTGTAVIFTAPEWTFEQGRLKLVSQSNTNTFGYWASPENAVPINEGYLYRARFTVSADVSQPEIVPQIRLRVNSSNFQQADCLSIDSNGDGGASPTPEGTTYDLYFVPPANDAFCMLAFDLLNFNPYDAAHAELALESVLVERFGLDTLDEPTTITWTYDFETTQEFWFPGDGTYAFTDPEFFWAEGALHLQSMTNTNTFGYWHSDPIDIIIEADRLYHGTFEVRTGEPERSLVPQMRLRFNTANMQAARTLEISSIGDGANSPDTINTTYDRLYFLPPPNCVGKGLIVSFDMLNFDLGDAAEASLILDRAIIETLSPPVLP